MDAAAEELRLKPLLYQLGKIPFSHPAELPERDLHDPQSEKEAVVSNVSKKLHRERERSKHSSC